MKFLLCFMLLYWSISPNSFAQNHADSLTVRLSKIVEDSPLVGIGVAIVSKDSLLYKNGFGYANLAHHIPYTDHTLQNIGSISKTLISLALLKCVEHGQLQLDDPINTYLPFKVFNPYFPNTPITIRMLATHTSSLTDGEDDLLIEKSYLLTQKTNFTKADLPEGYYELYEIYNKNVPLSMGQFLHRVYCPEGEWYDAANFSDKAPGTAYKYTNIGATLLAYIIETVTAEKFATFTQTQILDPLQMYHSRWDLDQVDPKHLTSLYLSNGQLIPHYRLITYPDGGLITSVADFSLYLMEMIRGLAGESQLLSQSSFKEMMSNQLTKDRFPNSEFTKSRGMNWNVNPEGDNIGANGADPGVTTYTLLTTSGNLGIVIFSNLNLYDNEKAESAFFQIRNTLLQYSGKLSKP